MLSSDLAARFGHNVRMASRKTPADFVAAYCARVAVLRKAMPGMTQKKMATALGISEASYSKYERRTPLPSRLVEQFAAIVGCEVEYVLTGEVARRKAKAQPKKAPLPVVVEQKSESQARITARAPNQKRG